MHTCVLVVTHNMDAWWSHTWGGLKGLHTDSKTSIFHPNNELTEHETTRDQPTAEQHFSSSSRATHIEPTTATTMQPITRLASAAIRMLRVKRRSTTQAIAVEALTEIQAVALAPSIVEAKRN